MATIGQRVLTEVRGRPTAVEQAFLDSVRTDLHSLESRTRGRFAETLILQLLGRGAHRSTYAAAAWDLCWQGITLGVRTAGQYNSETEWTENEEPLESALRWTFPMRSALTVNHEWSEIKRRAWTDAVVLAVHRGWSITEGWTFIVIEGETLNDEGVASLGITRALTLSTHDEELTAADLPGHLEAFFGTGRERTNGARFPVTCDDEIAHDHALRPR